MHLLSDDARRWRVPRRHPAVPGRLRRRGGSSLITGALVVAAAVVTLLLPLTIALPATVLLLLAVAVAHRRALSDLAAGVTLLVAQPYQPGERVLVHLDGGRTVEAELLQVRPLRTTLCTSEGVLAVRNTHMLRAPAA